MGSKEIEIVEFEYDPLKRRFGTTYSIREGGEFWKVGNGSRRRAWSTKEAAEEELFRYKLKNLRSEKPKGPRAKELTFLEEKLIHEFPDPNDWNGRNYDDI